MSFKTGGGVRAVGAVSVRKTHWAHGAICAGFWLFCIGSASAQDAPGEEPTADARLSLGGTIAGRRSQGVGGQALRDPAVFYTANVHAAPPDLPTPFILRRLDIDGVSGDTPLPLRHLYADLLGRNVDAAILAEVAFKITRHNAAAGFPARIAYFADQDFQNGLVKVSVSSGAVGFVEFVGAEGRTLKYLRSLASMLTEETPLRAETLTRFKHLANQVPGVSCTVAITPSANPLEPPNLVITVKHERFSSDNFFDNRAPRGIGRKILSSRAKARGLATGTDELDVQLIHNTGRGNAYLLIASYATVLNKRGLTAELGFFRSHFKPQLFGPSPPILGIINENYSVELSQPIHVSERLQVSANAGLAILHAQRSVNGPLQVRDRRRVSTLGLELDAQDAWGGVNYVSLQWLHGWDVLGATARGEPLASRQGDGAAFSTFILEVERVQKVGKFAELELATWTQASTQSLYEVDQCVYGGRDFGLGHEFEALYGDHCFLGLLELRSKPIALLAGANAAPYAFVDGAVIGFTGVPDIAARPFSALMSAGGGVRFKLNKHVSARVEANWPLRRSGIDFSASDERLYFRLDADF